MEHDVDYEMHKYNISKKRQRKFYTRKKVKKFCQVHKTSECHFHDNDLNEPKYQLIKSRKDVINSKNKDLCYCNHNSKNSRGNKKLKKEHSKASRKSVRNTNDYNLIWKEKKVTKTYDRDEECPICLDSMKGKNIKKLGCSHKLCIKCYGMLIKLDEKKFYRKINIPNTDITFTIFNDDTNLFQKYNLSNKDRLINYTMKCPICRSSIFNNKDSSVIM